jgi:hypothetical protein
MAEHEPLLGDCVSKSRALKSLATPKLKTLGNSSKCFKGLFAQVGCDSGDADTVLHNHV